jgi:hypothetical protein
MTVHVHHTKNSINDFRLSWWFTATVDRLVVGWWHHIKCWLYCWCFGDLYGLHLQGEVNYAMALANTYNACSSNMLQMQANYSLHSYWLATDMLCSYWQAPCKSLCLEDAEGENFWHVCITTNLYTGQPPKTSTNIYTFCAVSECVNMFDNLTSLIFFCCNDLLFQCPAIKFTASVESTEFG